VPLYTADALVLRTYALGESDRIVVFLTRDRGKKRGVAKGARRSRSRFGGALEPLTEARVAYFESARRELVGLNYAEVVRSPLAMVGTQPAQGCDALTYAAYFAELLNEWAQDADADDRLYRLGASMLDGLAAGVPVQPLARYFEYWVLRLQGVYPEARDNLSEGAQRFLTSARAVGPREAGSLGADDRVLRELESVHRSLITTHLEKTLKSDRVLRDLRRHA
jgi:DNA repair protein RecO (recombination protein O)